MKELSKAQFRQDANTLFTAMAREKTWMAFIVGLVVMMLTYRIELGAVIYSHGTQVARLQPSAVPLGDYLKTIINDFCFIALLGLCYLSCKLWMSRRFPYMSSSFSLKLVESIVAAAVLVTLALTERSHYQLLLQLDTGLTINFVKMAPTMFEADDFFRMLTWQDVVFIFTPLACFFLALVWSVWFGQTGKYIMFALLALILILQCGPSSRALSLEITSNPVVYLLSDTTRDWLEQRSRKNDFYAQLTDLPDDFQMHSIRLVDESFVSRDRRPPVLEPRPVLTAGGKPWNVMFFVLESTGADYIFDTSFGNQTPMPFLQKLTREGLYLANHHASANNSAQSAFSIFTGLYPSTSHNVFPMEKGVAIPTINRYFPTAYDYFLFHPTSPSFWFPQYMFLNNGLHDYYNMETLPPAHRAGLTELARNEIDSIDFLQNRLDHTPEPFLGIYWSFLSHYPYSDYGPEYRIVPGTTKKQAYYNNLHTLDIQLQRVFEHLEKTGVADHTLFVLVGDHGEAFQQHPGVWGHSIGNYSEMYRVPMLFWQPKLIQPEVIKFPTSHADIIPTLLDLLGMPYDDSKFQGESVLRGTPPRKYIFTMDAYADYVTAISAQMNKVSVGFNQDYVRVFNLQKDPGEKFPLSNNQFADQIEAIIKFRNYQSRMIDNYNQSIHLGYQFPPKRYFGSGSTNQTAIN